MYFYTHTPIVPFGSGTPIRQFTNARAYLDLGLDVEVIQISSGSNDARVILPKGAKHSLLTSVAVTPNLRQRIAYKIGFPFADVLQVLYNDRHSLLDLIHQQEKRAPGAIHHFENLSTANVAISLKDQGLNLVWSCHDWESDRNRKVSSMREEIGHRKPIIEKIRRRHFARQVEKQTSRACKLVLMIADHETRIFRDQLGIKNAEWFPMSWPQETLVSRSRAWVEGGTLRLLHVGSPDAMVGYYSLKFILGEVFPRLPADCLEKIELLVAGRMQDTEYSRVIRRLAQPYPQVKFLGYVDEIESLYAGADVHLVGNPVATGLRTRIIESFVCGIPVVSTPEAAEGIVGLEPGNNIILERSPEAFARQIIRLLQEPAILPGLAQQGRALYDRYYARAVAAHILRRLLEQYIPSSQG